MHFRAPYHWSGPAGVTFYVLHKRSCWVGVMVRVGGVKVNVFGAKWQSRRQNSGGLCSRFASHTGSNLQTWMRPGGLWPDLSSSEQRINQRERGEGVVVGLTSIEKGQRCHKTEKGRQGRSNREEGVQGKTKCCRNRSTGISFFPLSL